MANQRVVACPLEEAQKIEGRRNTNDYYDFGVAEASGGYMSTQLTRVGVERTEPTGWHYHTADVQWIYVIRGGVELQFEDGTSRRLGAGSVAYIPGRTPHNDIWTEAGTELVEIFIPPNPGTEACEPPEWARAEGATSADGY